MYSPALLGDTFAIEANSADFDLKPKIKSKPTPKPKLTHSRSMSHPFPSLETLFSSKKKNIRSNSTTGPAPKSALIDDDLGMPSSQPAKTRDRGGTTGTELATGNCMTCGSMVQWPKELDVFRCKICTTINDISSLGRLHSQGGGAPSRQRRNSQGPLTSLKPPGMPSPPCSEFRKYSLLI